MTKPEKYPKNNYSDIVANGDEISKHNFTLPETIELPKVKADGIKYTDHLFANADGILKNQELNGWEQAVLAEEQKRRTMFAGFEDPCSTVFSAATHKCGRKMQRALSDFIIVRRDPILKPRLTLLERLPHNRISRITWAKLRTLQTMLQMNQNWQSAALRIGKDAAGKSLLSGWIFARRYRNGACRNQYG